MPDQGALGARAGWALAPCAAGRHRSTGAPRFRPRSSRRRGQFPSLQAASRASSRQARRRATAPSCSAPRAACRRLSLEFFSPCPRSGWWRAGSLWSAACEAGGRAAGRPLHRGRGARGARRTRWSSGGGLTAGSRSSLALPTANAGSPRSLLHTGCWTTSSSLFFLWATTSHGSLISTPGGWREGKQIRH